MRSSTAERPHPGTSADGRLGHAAAVVPRTAARAVLVVGVALVLSACTGGPSASPAATGTPSSTASSPAPAASAPSGAGRSEQPTSVLPTDLAGIATGPAGVPPDEDIDPGSGPLPTWDDASRAGVVQAAAAAMAAFAQPGADHDTWWAGLREHVTPESAPDLVLVDPANISASRVTGDGRIAADTSAAVATVVVPTDSGEWTLVMVRASGVDPWLADRITPPAGQH